MGAQETCILVDYLKFPNIVFVWGKSRNSDTSVQTLKRRVGVAGEVNVTVIIWEDLANWLKGRNENGCFGRVN